MMSIKKGLLTVLIALLFTFSFAGTTGRLVGVVYDDNRNRISYANVQIDRDSTWTTIGICTENGTYDNKKIPPGIYTVTFTYKDYSTVIVDSVSIDIEKTTVLKANLIKNSTETIRYKYVRKLIDISH